MADFQKSEPGLAGQKLTFQREDWSLFRTIEGLQQRAGVPKDKLVRLVLKELADNGLDTGAEVRAGRLPDGGYFVEDDGGGIEPDHVARLFSIARPMVSTKLWRVPSRGALGNGLRVVAGAVLASRGMLTVITRNRKLGLRPERDGTTTLISNEPTDFPTGTRIEIGFGPSMPSDPHALAWAQAAILLARPGETYNGKPSPWWYDAAQFHELLYASGKTPVRELIAKLDGCSGATAGEIVGKAGLIRATCDSVTRKQSDRLLSLAKDNARQVNPARLGEIGGDTFSGAYACAQGYIKNSGAPIPHVIEVWAKAAPSTGIAACINRTPITGNLHASRDKRDINVFGCGLAHTIATAPKDENFDIRLSIITPFMPITSDGKAPNMEPFLAGIASAAKKAVRKARRPSAGNDSQKDIVLDNLDDAIAKVSDNGQFRFNQRQILYALRPIIREITGKELTTANFTSIITDYESERGEIRLMYREPRGSLYHPHQEETITLGTLMVEEYERPVWTFNKLVYIEKEGFSEALKAVNWAERHDCALMSSKGFTTRAARDLVDKLAEHDEPCTIYCVHDADAYGTMIYQTFQMATRARGARKIKIINLGLEPWEAEEMGLEIEDVDEGKRRKPVAEYVLDRANGDHWEDWLQNHRIELNAMTTPEFIEWLDAKMEEHADGKLIPPAEVLQDTLAKQIEAEVRKSVAERILREARLDDQVAAAIAAIEKPDPATLEAGIKEMFDDEPERQWCDHIQKTARDLAVGKP